MEVNSPTGVSYGWFARRAARSAHTINTLPPKKDSGIILL